MQLLHRRPDLEVVPLRGNVDTRVKKMDTLGLDALILAAAGLNRLGLAHIYRGCVPETDMLPAVGQGALGLEVRTADQDLRELVAFLDDPPTHLAVTAERAFLARLEGGCVVPGAALGRVAGETLYLDALISDLEGRRVRGIKGPRPWLRQPGWEPNWPNGCWIRGDGKSWPDCTGGLFKFKN